jgi:hypothetical protein
VPKTCNNGCDKGFYELIDKLKSSDIEVLLAEAVASVREYLTTDKRFYRKLWE